MDWIILIIVLSILGGAITYIIRAKKRGEKCIGCPTSGGCCHQNKTCSCQHDVHTDTH